MWWYPGVCAARVPARRWHFCTSFAPDVHQKSAKTKMEDWVWIHYSRERREISLIVLNCTQKGAHTTHLICPGQGVSVCAICVRVHMTGRYGTKCPRSMNRAIYWRLWVVLAGCKVVQRGAQVQTWLSFLLSVVEWGVRRICGFLDCREFGDGECREIRDSLRGYFMVAGWDLPRGLASERP